MERVFPISSKADIQKGIDWELTYQASHVDGSEWMVESWSLSICKQHISFKTNVASWKCLSFTCEEVPEAIYDTLNALCEKHLQDNPIIKEEL